MPFPTAAFKRAARHHADPITVHRRQDDDNSTYGNKPEYSELESVRQILVAGMEETQQSTSAGENQSQRMTAYAAPDVDLQINDRIEIGAGLLEVMTKTGHPREGDTAVYRYELDDV